MRLHPAWTCSLLPVLAAPTLAGTFEDLGIPVTKAGNMGILVGPNRDGTRDLVYLNYMQAGAPLFVLSVDPDTGETHQYPAPQETGGWAFVLGPDKKVYVGTFGEGLILRFDPAKPDDNVTIVGKPSPTESYVWQLVLAPDGKLYGCTYPQAKLVSFDPATGKMEDLGRMDPVEMYSRTVAAAPNGKIYTGVGPTRQGLVVYDPQTREHRELLPEKWRINNFIAVQNGADGNVYAGITHPTDDGKTVSETFRLDDETLVPVTAVPGKTLTLRDGREIVGHAEGNKGGSFQVRDPKSGESRTVTFEYKGAGSIIFMVGAGPGESVYGSTAMPLEVFRNDPEHGNEHLGNMPGGEVYS
ncbi:MAG: hypothetical protein HYU66_11555, partial [Armatimonadetes bacterium]|nr:hypothetical protein [Armatimonadota bacterium]